MARSNIDLLDLEVVSLEDASVAGQVDGLIVDGKELQVAGLLVDLGIYEAKAVAYTDLKSVGEHAVTIESPAVLKKLSEHPRLEETAQLEIDVSDSVVVTDKGDIVGSVGDYYVDTASGKIKGIELIVEDEPEEKVLYLPASEIVRVGREIVIVRAGFEKRGVPSGEAL